MKILFCALLVVVCLMSADNYHLVFGQSEKEQEALIEELSEELEKSAEMVEELKQRKVEKRNKLTPYLVSFLPLLIITGALIVHYTRSGRGIWQGFYRRWFTGTIWLLIYFVIWLALTLGHVARM